MLVGDLSVELRAIRNCIDALEIGSEWLSAGCFDAGGIHAARVEHSELARVWIPGSRCSFSCGFEHVLEDEIIALGELVEWTPRREGCGHGVAGEPSAAGELVEIGTGFGRGIEISESKWRTDLDGS